MQMGENKRQVHPIRFYAEEPRTCPWHLAMVSRLWHGYITSPFPPSGNEGFSELVRAPKAPGVVHIYVQRSHSTQQRKGWVCILRGQCLQVHHLNVERCGGNLGYVSRPGSQDDVRVGRPEHKALLAHRKCWEVTDPLNDSEHSQEHWLRQQELKLN